MKIKTYYDKYKNMTLGEFFDLLKVTDDETIKTILCDLIESNNFCSSCPYKEECIPDDYIDYCCKNFKKHLESEVKNDE